MASRRRRIRLSGSGRRPCAAVADGAGAAAVAPDGEYLAADPTTRIRPAGPNADPFDARSPLRWCGLLFGAAVLASARPSGWWWSSAAPDPPEDIMLCVGEPVTDQITGEFLTYFAGQARTYGTQRIGLTSPNRRVIPMTRDYQYVAGRLGDLAQLSRRPGRRGGRPAPLLLARGVVCRLRAERRGHSGVVHDRFPVIRFHELTPPFVDLSGPGSDTRPARGKAVAADRRSGQLAWRASPASRSTRSAPRAEMQAHSRSIAKSSGGQYFSLDGREDQLAGDLDTIRTSPPAPPPPPMRPSRRGSAMHPPSRWWSPW